MANQSDSRPAIILNSPVGSKPATYKWPLTYVSKGQKIDGAEDIVETINWVANEFPEFEWAIKNLLREKPDLKNYSCIKSLCDRYNKILETVLKMNKGTSVAPKTSSWAGPGLVKHIIAQVYNYAVKDPNELNKYSPFSSKVYGETNFDFMAELVTKDLFRPRENDIFIDMGSGVGHLVLQMAASVKCRKCYGIEISDVPAGYAKVMEERFKFWMEWYGKTYTDFELFHGDFFNKEYADIIKKSTYILVNNFAFKPEVDNELKQRFLDLKDGAQILSSKRFCSTKTRVNERHLSDIGSIMKVKEIHPEQKNDTVSWTHKPLPYYLHTLDATKMEKYYEKKKRKQARSSERGKPSKRRRAGEGSESDESSDDNLVRGPTTRRAWNEQCNATGSSNRASAESVKTASSRNNSTDTEHYESTLEADDGTAPSKVQEEEIGIKKEKKNDQSSNIERSTTTQGSSAQQKAVASGSNRSEAKSCLDKKRDYAFKKTDNTSSHNGNSSTLYSISKPAETSNGTSKIPSIVIKKQSSNDSRSLGEDSKTTATTLLTQREDQKSQETKSNGTKKLRQRKKSNNENPEQEQTKQKSPQLRNPRVSVRQAQASKVGPKVSPKAVKATTSANSILSATTTTTSTRGKKAQALATKQPPNKTQTSSKRKNHVPDDSLELLHNKTVESVLSNSGYYPLPAPGCVDYNLRTISETPSIPKFSVKDLAMFVNDFLGSKMREKFDPLLKHEVDAFARKIQQPGVRESLLRDIERARIHKNMLLRDRDELEREIKFLHERVYRAMQAHCDDLGIQNSFRSIVVHLGAALKKHQDLTAYAMQLESSLQTNQRTMNPPAAHSNSHLSSPYRNTAASATLDLSLKPGS